MLDDEAIYHLVDSATWVRRPAGDFVADSLATEGFVHCSYGRQVRRTVERFWSDPSDLLVLKIDADRIAHILRVEDTAGHGEKFPHIYGQLPEAAVLTVQSWSTVAQESVGNA